MFLEYYSSRALCFDGVIELSRTEFGVSSSTLFELLQLVELSFAF